MLKTPFAGLTELDPSESLSTDGFSFQSRNPRIIDRYLQVGAVTHRHDAHAALVDPAAPPSAAVTPTGGQIAADTPIYLEYTLLDSTGGETLPAPVALVTTLPAYQVPTTMPSASADYSGGSLMANTYWYALTLTDGEGGETPLGPIVTVTRAPGYASGQVRLWELTADFAENSATGWRLYRALPGQQFGLLATGSADSYTDDGSISTQCSIQPPPPGQNTTQQTNLLTVIVPSGQPSEAVSFNLYATNTGDFISPSLLGNYPIASAGAAIDFPQLVVFDGSPPAVSTCIPGASQINPDTDLLNWTWKRPVPTQAMLPSAASGDTRAVEDIGQVFISPSGGADWRSWLPATILVRDQAGNVAPNKSAVEFIGSGTTSVGVSQSGGSAVVTITGAAGGGGVASYPNIAPSGASATGTPVPGANGIDFAGSGAASVNVQSGPGGSAIVTITALAPGSGPQGPAGAQGPAGTGGAAAIGSAISFASASAGIYASAYGTPGVPGSSGGWSVNATETWASNDLGSWDEIAGTSEWTWSTGQVANTGTWDDLRWQHEDTDQRFTVNLVTIPSATQVDVGFYLPGTNNGIGVFYYTNGSSCQVATFSGGPAGRSNIESAGYVSGVTWLRVTKSGNDLIIEGFTSDPTSGSPAPVMSHTYTMTGATATSYGTGVAMRPFIGAGGGAGVTYGKAYWELPGVTPAIPDTRHTEEHVWAIGASGSIDRILIDDMGRSDFLLDVVPSGGSATGKRASNVETLHIIPSAGVRLNVASAVSSKTPGASAAVVTVAGGYVDGKLHYRALGVASLAWSSSTLSGVITIPHGLPSTPTAIQWTFTTPAGSNGDLTVYHNAAPDGTNLYVIGRCPTSITGTCTLYWSAET